MNRAPLKESFWLPVVISVALHGGLIAFVLWGWDATPETKRIVTPSYVKATLVEMKAKAKPAATKKNKVVDLTAKRKQQEKLKRDAEKKRQANIKRDKERKALDAKKAKELKQAEEKRLAEQQEADRQRNEQQRLQRESEMADALAEEEQMLAEEQDVASVQSYVAMMAAKVEQSWSRPPSARNGMRCQLQIQLVPTGEVVSVTVTEGSGNSAFDRSAEQAVKKVGRFDALKGMDSALFERNFRQLTLVFAPQDLRL